MEKAGTFSEPPKIVRTAQKEAAGKKNIFCAEKRNEAGSSGLSLNALVIIATENLINREES